MPVGCAIRFATLGVNPAVVDRYTSYFVTPTLSVAAPQLNAAELAPAVAVRVPGADGGVVSGGGTTTVTGTFMSVSIWPTVSA